MTYAPLIISAIDHTTGQLTITAHGLITGGGFAASPRGPLYGGAIYAPPGGVIPTGLTPVTTYWPIVVDADHIKLADSNAHAMTGTAVSFSTNGTLPLQFLVGLPYELPRISAPGTQDFSDDKNTAWQALKALWALLSGQAQSVFPVSASPIRPRTLPISAAKFVGDATPALKYDDGGGTTGLVVRNNTTGSAFVVKADVPIPVGGRITAFRVTVGDSAVGPTKLQATLISVAAATGLARAVVGTTAVSSGGGTVQTLPVTGLAFDVAAGSSLHLRVASTTGTDTAFVVDAEVDWFQAT